MRTLTLSVCIALLAGCGTTQGPKEESGQAAGVLLGALVGAAIGKNSNARAAGFFAGAVAGGMIGRSIGRHLDEGDRLKAQAAANAAIRESGPTRVSWQSDANPNVSGTVLTGPAKATSQGNCKPVRHIVYVNGREVKEDGRACQQSDGSWQLA